MNTDTVYKFGEIEVKIINSGPPWKENCYLLRHLPTNAQLIIDPGANAQLIRDQILSHGSSLSQIWLTHAHHDHVGAAAELSQYFDIPCQLHQADQRLLRHSPMYALRFGGLQIEAPTRVEYFETPCVFTFVDQSVEVINTPGHSSGGVCYCFDGFVFTGDTLVYNHMGRTDLPGGDESIIKDSISTLLGILPSDTMLFGGHSQPWRVEEALHWWASIKNNPPKFTLFEKSEGNS